jgi:hypothetical protein
MAPPPLGPDFIKPLHIRHSTPAAGKALLNPHGGNAQPEGSNGYNVNFFNSPSDSNVSPPLTGQSWDRNHFVSPMLSGFPVSQDQAPGFANQIVAQNIPTIRIREASEGSIATKPTVGAPVQWLAREGDRHNQNEETVNRNSAISHTIVENAGSNLGGARNHQRVTSATGYGHNAPRYVSPEVAMAKGI